MGLSRILLTNPRYILLALLVAFAVFTFALWLPNLSLISVVLGTDALMSEKFIFMLGFYLSLTTNFTLLSGSLTIIISLLFGLNVLLLFYYIKQRRVLFSNIKTSTSSLSGLIFGFLGIGCAACGSFLLTYFLGLFGATALLAWLPLQGEELAFLGIFLLIYSCIQLLKKINQPLVC